MTRPIGWDTAVGGPEVAGEQHDHWAHHDVVVLGDGRLLTPGPAGGLLVISDGAVVGRIATDTNEIHGMAVTVVDGEARVWLADCGFTMVRDDDGEFHPGGRGGSRGPRAVEIDLDGTELRSFSVPRIDAYADAMYLPTSVTVDETRHGGSGDVWVADGYGAGLVHRFTDHGVLRTTLDGTEGAGRFDTPHAVFIDRRRAEPRLLVADRGNARIQAFGLDGSFITAIGEGVLTSPSAFAVRGDRLIVAELHASVAVLDADDVLVGRLGDDEAVIDRPGWPNALDADGRAVRPDLDPTRFNSPHGLTVDADGRLIVSEWLIGGRVVALDLDPEPETMESGPHGN